MSMNRNTKKGFLSVEASIFVPVFIIAILTFGYLIKVAAVQESVMHAMADEARRIGMYSYNIKAAPLLGMGLKERILEENGDIGETNIESFLYLFSYAGKDDLVSVRVSSNIKIKLPIVFVDSVDVSDTLLFRAFTGREFIPEELNFDEMEEEEESRIVWVFPTAGERYHDEGCGYIKVAAKQEILTPSVARQYKPCSLCGAGSMAAGSVVYCFPGNGEVFHNGSCFIVDRYVISIDEEDAIKKGYLPCSKCI